MAGWSPIGGSVDESRLIGKDDELGAIARADFAHRASNMGLAVAALTNKRVAISRLDNPWATSVVISCSDR